MKRTYENFTELAETMVDGYGMLHSANCPSEKDCIPWQRGILDFAGWLDHIGAKVEITDGAKGFYEYMRKENK